MSPKVRLYVFLAGAAGFGLVLLVGMTGLAPAGQTSSPPPRTVGDWLNRVALPERHLTNVVSAVNFDYRGLDTLGEEYILFAAVAGVALLLRERRGESEQDRPEGELDRVWQHRSEAVRWSGRWMVGLVNLFGIYVVAHAQLTPGGGFQGGVILGTGSLLVYLAETYQIVSAGRARSRGSTWRDRSGPAAMRWSACSAWSWAVPSSRTSSRWGRPVRSSRRAPIPIINLFVGLEVTAGFALLFSEFLEETRQEPRRVPS